MTAELLLAQVPIIIAIIGYALHNEHRLTQLETKVDRLITNGEAKNGTQAARHH